MIACPHWSAGSPAGVGHCALGRAGGRPSAGVCALCLAGVDVGAVPEAGREDGAGLSRLMQERGPVLWRRLHAWALDFAGTAEEARAWLNAFRRELPCGECRRHWSALCEEWPPPLDDPRALFRWSVQQHNRVRLRLDQEPMNLADAQRLYAPDLGGFFDAVIVLNLDRRADRWEEFQRDLASAQPWPFRTPERFAATDASKVPVPVGWHSGGGAWGCMQSHRRILEWAMHAGHESILVLEDDAQFVPDFPRRVAAFLRAVPDDWGQLMLGGQFFHDSKIEKVAPGVVKVDNCQRTHAYAVRGKFLRDLYAKWCASHGHCDHVMGPFQRGRAVYAPEEFLVAQREGKSDISGAHNPAKRWVPPQQDAPVYWFTDLAALEPVRGRGFHGGRRREAGIDVGLAALMAGPETSRPRELAKWLSMIEWEGRSMTPECYAALYHPALTEELLRRVVGDRLRIVAGGKSIPS